MPLPVTGHQGTRQALLAFVPPISRLPRMGNVDYGIKHRWTEHYIPGSPDMMGQTKDCSPVWEMQHKVMYFLYPSQKILVKINLPGQKSYPFERETFLTSMNPA